MRKINKNSSPDLDRRSEKFHELQQHNTITPWARRSGRSAAEHRDAGRCGAQRTCGAQWTLWGAGDTLLSSWQYYELIKGDQCASVQPHRDVSGLAPPLPSREFGVL
jgi:hypothetical protein